MAGWGQRWAAACGRECVPTHPAAAPRHMSTRGVQQGGSGACRAGAVRALAQPGRPGSVSTEGINQAGARVR